MIVNHCFLFICISGAFLTSSMDTDFASVSSDTPVENKDNLESKAVYANFNMNDLFGVVSFVEKTDLPAGSSLVEIRVNLLLPGSDIQWEIRFGPTLWGQNISETCQMSTARSNLMHNLTLKHGLVTTRAVLLDNDIKISSSSESIIGSSLIFRRGNAVLACSTILPKLVTPQEQVILRTEFYSQLSGSVDWFMMKTYNISFLNIILYSLSGSLSATKPYRMQSRAFDSTSGATISFMDLGTIYPGSSADWEVVNMTKKLVPFNDVFFSSDSVELCISDPEIPSRQICSDMKKVKNQRKLTSFLVQDATKVSTTSNVKNQPPVSLFQGNVVMSQVTRFHPNFMELHLYDLRNQTAPASVVDMGTKSKDDAVYFQYIEIHDKAISSNICLNELANNNQLEITKDRIIDLAKLAHYKESFGEGFLVTVQVPVWFTLFGKESIIGKSLHSFSNGIDKKMPRIHLCGNLIPQSAVPKKATVRVESKNVQGIVSMVQYMEQNGEATETILYMDINYKSNNQVATSSHRFHIHEKPPGPDQFDPDLLTRCKSTGGHYNPFKVDVREPKYSMQCNQNFHGRCEVGDLSKRHNEYLIGGGSKQFVDTNLPVYTVQNESVIGRSLCVHHHVMSVAIMACGKIESN